VRSFFIATQIFDGFLDGLQSNRYKKPLKNRGLATKYGGERGILLHIQNAM
jgi:hypothetical protein